MNFWQNKIIKYQDKEKWTKKGKIAYWSFCQLYYFDVGRNKTVGRFTSWFTEVGVAYSVLKLSGIKVNLFIGAVVVISGILLFSVVGRIYTKLRLDEIESIQLAERNPYMNSILVNVDKEKSSLKEGF